MNYRQTKSAALYLLLGAALPFTMLSCATEEKKTSEKAEKFQVIKPMLVDTVYQEEYVAEIHALQNVEIRTRVKGFIEHIHIDEGKEVTAGQLLFTLSSRSFKEDLLKANAQLKSATAELKAMEVELKNTKSLVEKNIVSKTELEMVQAKKEAVQAKIDEANSAIAMAKLNLSFTEVRAPFSGVINRIPNKRGSLVEEGTLLTTISNNKEVFAYFNLSESDYLNYITAGKTEQFKTAQLLLANNSVYNHTGTIEISESEFDASSGNIAFRARFPNPGALLKHGGNGKIIITKPLKNAMLIPLRSTFEIQDKVFVFAVDEKNKAKQKTIVPKMRIPHYYVVERGISKDDKIVYEGVENVKDGDAINPQLIEPESATYISKN
ncbi:membrane fusion protein (multidrug efflux system) [Lacibacter cauensis]|uniref:Membrane fusion protein (Multidrug efflux system) n=1 Tax=Lacibacter cauensis TaxID=510947 RepID=A0A562SKA3_9BACT|nr:efflux RND transporter periplasmic adaptor subunit [Lacibacter cauensis]TWI81598.1 membrane fusion protein (multidrug efflux system) [Lacibacter cauensis]